MYCLDVGWDISECGSGLSHLSINLLLNDCPCACDEGYILFPDTVGTGTCEPVWGNLGGVLPGCECVTSVEESTRGGVKALFQ